MKRKTYHVTINGQHAAKKHTWNAALRGVSKLIRPLLVEGEIAERQGVHAYRHSADGSMTYGNELWVSNHGRKFNVEIERVF